MELDVMSMAMPLRSMQDLARRAETAGFGTLWLTESGRTAYLSCTAAALATEDLGIGTAIAVAFPRSPMITAKVAWELAETTGGRFVLGLGSQVRAHIERRYSAAYAPPGPRLREYVQSLRRIFAAFRGDEKLDFKGEHYQFSLLPREWSPGPIGVPDPPIYISAVRPWMTRMAGELCDGVHVHPFHSPQYVTDVMRPELEAGAAKGGRTLGDLTLVCPIMTAVGDTDEEQAANREHARFMIAFYGSTRTYSPIFEIHGFDGLSEQLHARQREGDFAGMAALVSDDILDHYIVSGTWSELGPKLVDRYRDVAPNVRVMTYTASHQYQSDPDIYERWSEVATAMRTA
ncbi:MAG: TIGR03617 family F420-dependent LLM class oxidoreductase [Acidimicrobiales bacterium]